MTLLAEERVEDSEGDYTEVDEIYNATGTISVDSMDSLGSEYDDATINDVKYPARWDASGLDQQGEDGNYAVYYEDAQDPGYNRTLNASYRMSLPSVIDLSYSGVELKMTQKWVDSRYIAVEKSGDVSDSTNLSEASLSSVSTQSKGDSLTLVGSGISAGTDYVIHIEAQFTDDEIGMIEAAPEGSGAVAVGGGGAISGGLTAIIGTLTAAAVVFRKRLMSIIGQIGG